MRDVFIWVIFYTAAAQGTATLLFLFGFDDELDDLPYNAIAFMGSISLVSLVIEGLLLPFIPR